MGKKISENIDREVLLDLIIKKYGSQRELAKVMDETDIGISQKLNVLSNKFVKRLRDVGVDVDKAIINKSQIYHLKGNVNQNLFGDNRNANINYVSENEMKNIIANLTIENQQLKARIIELESQLKKNSQNEG